MDTEDKKDSVHIWKMKVLEDQRNMKACWVNYQSTGRDIHKVKKKTSGCKHSGLDRALQYGGLDRAPQPWHW